MLLLVWQVDDLFLATEEAVTGVPFRVTTTDFTNHINWLKTINAAMPAGSAYKWVAENISHYAATCQQH